MPLFLDLKCFLYYSISWYNEFWEDLIALKSCCLGMQCQLSLRSYITMLMQCCTWICSSSRQTWSGMRNEVPGLQIYTSATPNSSRFAEVRVDSFVFVTWIINKPDNPSKDSEQMIVVILEARKFLDFRYFFNTNIEVSQRNRSLVISSCVLISWYLPWQNEIQITVFWMCITGVRCDSSVFNLKWIAA